jgi:hypothetical protein
MSKLVSIQDWVIAGAIDREWQQYTVLGYLQRVDRHFAEHKLYPHLDELKQHIEDLERIQAQRMDLEDRLSGTLVGFDPRTGGLIRQRPADDELSQTVDAALALAQPRLKKAFERGHELRSQLAEQVQCVPIGILPLNVREGWMVLRTGREARVYAYAMPMLRRSRADELYQSVHTRYFTSFTLGMDLTYERIKARLVDLHKDLPVPATFAFEAEVPLPHIETFMPLAKQLVYEVIAARADQ